VRTRTINFKSQLARVDWLTCTANSPAAAKILWDVGHSLLDTRKRKDENASRWHVHGYSGWKSTGVGIGARGLSTMLQLSGEEARDHWQHGVRACENVSRLDLAIDSEADPPMPRLAGELYRKVHTITPKTGRPPCSRLAVGSDGGATCYVGARVSEQFGRLYDKGIEQKTQPKGHWWRWEVEVKGDAARSLAMALEGIPEPGMAIAAHVRQWFADRCAIAPAGAAAGVKCFETREPSTNERRLAWLSSSVRPTVRMLLDAGLRDEVLFSLGLLPEKRSDPS